MTTSATFVKATDKQVKFILDLLPWYYDGNADKAKHLCATVSASRKLSKRDASTAISIMLPVANVVKTCHKMLASGRGGATNYYAANVDMDDETDDIKLNAIWDNL